MDRAATVKWSDTAQDFVAVCDDPEADGDTVDGTADLRAWIRSRQLDAAQQRCDCAGCFNRMCLAAAAALSPSAEREKDAEIDLSSTLPELGAAGPPVSDR